MINIFRAMIHRLALREGWHFVSLYKAPIILAYWNGYNFSTRQYGAGEKTIFRTVETYEIDHVFGRLTGSVNNPKPDEVIILRTIGMMNNPKAYQPKEKEAA